MILLSVCICEMRHYVCIVFLTIEQNKTSLNIIPIAHIILKKSGTNTNTTNTTLYYNNYNCQFLLTPQYHITQRDNVI